MNPGSHQLNKPRNMPNPIIRRTRFTGGQTSLLTFDRSLPRLHGLFIERNRGHILPHRVKPDAHLGIEEESTAQRCLAHGHGSRFDAVQRKPLPENTYP